MKHILKLLAIVAIAIWGAGSATLLLGDDRITLTVTLTNQPVNTDTITVNSDVRTAKTSVVTPSTEFAIGGSIEATRDNLYFQIAKYPFSGPLLLSRSGTNVLTLVGQVGQTLSASATTNWASLVLSTQTVTTLKLVRSPIAGEPTASVRTNISSDLVDAINNFSTNAFSETATATANLVNKTGTQTITGPKTFSSVTTGGGNFNGIIKRLLVQYGTTNNGVHFWPSGGSASVFVIAPDLNGRPSIFAVSQDAGGNDIENPSFTYTPVDNNILTLTFANTKFGALASTNVWTGPNTFQNSTNGTFWNATLTNAAAISGTVAALTNGTWYTPTLSSGKNKDNAFQSYNGSDTTTLQLGLSAAAAGSGATALGDAASASGNDSTAIGKSANATHTTSTAIGKSAATTQNNQIRLGTAAENVSAPGNAYAGGIVAAGHDWPTLPTGQTKGFYTPDGADLSADPVAAISFWSSGGTPFYRGSAASEGSGANNHVHNRYVKAVGSGSDFTIAGTAYARVDFGGQDPELTLPTAGTWYLIYQISVTAGGTANDSFAFKLYNSTDAADISDSEASTSNIAASQVDSKTIHAVVSVTGSKVIQLYGRNATAARGTIKAVETRCFGVRLY